MKPESSKSDAAAKVAQRVDAHELEVASGTRTYVVVPILSRRPGEGGPSRSPAARLEEAVGLAGAIDLAVVGSGLVTLAEIRPATYIGKGKVEEIAGLVKAEEITLVLMDCALSPVQQRNLEKAWGAKVIDRTGLILEIFGRRARTREGALQVELAHLNYQKGRLVRSWTHLERQRGGGGFLGGPGETQIESDRRLLQDRIVKLERELEQVKRTRALHRSSRRKVPFPIVALVGYTNAGKSTLFNRLTRAEVLAQDMLFATLDPTLRALKLPHGSKAILSDTVGFISDLPTMLVAAFRATLEEVMEADVVLHVRDISHGDTDAQAADVRAILGSLGIDGSDGRTLIEVWNKVDLLGEVEREALITASQRDGADRPIVVSALTGEGTGLLLERIEGLVSAGRLTLDVDVPPSDGAGLAWLHKTCDVLSREAGEDGVVHVRVRVAPERVDQVRRRFGLAA
ncbi:GTPase HflX [Labrys wisconsinensis]|uniref:GTPase HflX n=1 Tax=Labrys wisconsinensis TaxID=425677 RepID=A0ABU0J4L5_9HYPH|nr:GTPase HflX [Labrys wisconsinensis]MDQ0469174.1 GTP-binding protein HflX [Labrys wisconsinensis]